MRQARGFAAWLRKHARQRQSPVDASSETGSRNGSPAHQQSPSRLQSNAAPQPAQTSWRGGGAVARGSIAVGRDQIPRFQKSK
jgi:hypothetical protein